MKNIWKNFTEWIKEKKYQNRAKALNKEPLTIDEENDIIRHYEEYINTFPELWVAKNAHRVYCGEFRMYVFRNLIFEKWIYEVYTIMHELQGDYDELRKKLLTIEEINQINEEIQTNPDFE